MCCPPCLQNDIVESMHKLPAVCIVAFSCLQVSAPVEQRSEQEIFYSCPSASAEAFFEAVSNQLAGLETSAYADTASTQLEQALELAQAVQVCP
jgi:hypothetical protein